MAWVRVDDTLYSHPKIMQVWAANRGSIGIWLFGASWAAQHRTDGHVTAEHVNALTAGRRERDRLVEPLVDAGLWVPNGDGWAIHDWRDYNGTRAEVSAHNRAKWTGR